MAKLHAQTKPSKSTKHKVSHVHITRGANGFAVHHDVEQPPRKPGSLSYGPAQPDPKPNYFADKQGMLDHVGGLADQMGGDEPDAAQPGQPA